MAAARGAAPGPAARLCARRALQLQVRAILCQAVCSRLSRLAPTLCGYPCSVRPISLAPCRHLGRADEASRSERGKSPAIVRHWCAACGACVCAGGARTPSASSSWATACTCCAAPGTGCTRTTPRACWTCWRPRWGRRRGWSASGAAPAAAADWVGGRLVAGCCWRRPWGRRRGWSASGAAPATAAADGWVGAGPAAGAALPRGAGGPGAHAAQSAAAAAADGWRMGSSWVACCWRSQGRRRWRVICGSGPRSLGCVDPWWCVGSWWWS